MKRDQRDYITKSPQNDNGPRVLVLDVARRAEAAARELAEMATTASERRLVGLILSGAAARAGLL